jgi:hypothetical protein
VTEEQFSQMITKATTSIWEYWYIFRSYATNLTEYLEMNWVYLLYSLFLFEHAWRKTTKPNKYKQPPQNVSLASY